MCLLIYEYCLAKLELESSRFTLARLLTLVQEVLGDDRGRFAFSKSTGAMLMKIL